MASRTYIPSLVDTVRRMCVYIAKHGSIIRANLPPDAVAAFDALELACMAFNAFSEEIDPPSP